MAENEIHVLGYAEPATDEAPIPGYEMVGAAQAQGLIAKQAWYIEEDAIAKAAELAGRNVVLPYFFIGDAPEDGKTWPKHRCGGLRFMEQWLAARAGDKLEQDATATAQDVVEDGVEAKLKAERKTTRALRRELKELQEHTAGVERADKATTERNEKQAATINRMDKRTSAMRKALVQVEDRVSVALDLLEKIPLISPQRDHLVAELTSARALVREVIPSSYGPKA